MGYVSLAFTAVFLIAFVNIAEVDSCSNSGYRIQYYKEKYQVDCGWWNKCDKYRHKTKSVTCPVNGKWGSWTSWSSYSKCSKTCGTGTQFRTRSRHCNNPSRKFGGAYCSGSSLGKTTIQCNTTPCPVDGKWSPYSMWSKWGECSETCGIGVQKKTRTRNCTPPRYGGKPCGGSATEELTKQCNLEECPVDGKWSKYSKWSKWGECSETCGIGVQKRTRTRKCTPPRYGGNPCIGSETDELTKQCTLKECPGFCKCSTVGESNYKTFDGQWIAFIGSCRYMLAESVNKSKCQFSVEVTNTPASQISKLPYHRKIDISIDNTNVRLLRDKTVVVDNRKVLLPYETQDKSIEIFMSGRYIRVQTNCGLDAEFDGDQHFELVVLDTFANHMKGLCGDCDGEKNDLKTKDGTDMSNNTVRFSKIADSWARKDEALKDDLTCSDATEVSEVSDEITKIASSNEYCGYLQDEDNSTSPFKKCFQSKELKSSHYFDMCAKAVSLFHNKNVENLENAVCNHLAAFAAECEEEDIRITWRSEELCPLSCGVDQTYSNHVSGCQENCVNHNSKTPCDLPITEGCSCKKGYVLGGNGCVKKEECGCNSKLGYIAPGDEIMSVDCKTTYKCVSANGTVSVEEKTADHCHKHAICHVDEDGDSSCKCKDGYMGDGIKECESVCKTDHLGETYSGKQQTTVKGKKCQPWADSKFDTLANDNNYCRNPDEENGPWCYTDVKKKRWDLCYVPMCDVKECRTEATGADYSGYKSTTESGYKCQSWGSQTPHTHRFKGMDDAKNYCRNPDNEPKPWCYTTNPNKRWEFCDIPMCDNEVTTCKTSKLGRKYDGHKNTTKSGLICQEWGSQKPHGHRFGHIKSLVAANNYCRNPDGEPEGPWCYTTDQKVRWEYCDIPMCGEASNMNGLV